MEKQVLESQKLSISSWPSPQDYNEALQLAEHSFADAELAQGQAMTDALGLPRPITGMFASVYEMHCGSHIWAVRCFLNNSAEQMRRYVAISQTLASLNLQCTVAFVLQNQGIRVRSNWYPILKMEWCHGVGLSQWLQRHYQDKERLESFLEIWLELIQELKHAGIAHGDLQHGNVLVQSESLKLVDYDGMYIPQFSGLASSELGHRNYQHPRRSAQDFGPWLDNFSAWLIYLSVKMLILDPELWNEFNGGDECILFHKEDLEDPAHSELFHALEKENSEELKNCSRSLRYLLTLSPCDVPDLNLALAIPAMPELPFHLAESDESTLPDWLKDGDESRYYRENADYAGFKRRGKKRRSGSINPYDDQQQRREDERRHRQQEIRAEEYWHSNSNKANANSGGLGNNNQNSSPNNNATNQFSNRPGGQQQLYGTFGFEYFQPQLIMLLIAFVGIWVAALCVPKLSNSNTSPLPVPNVAHSTSANPAAIKQSQNFINSNQWRNGQYIHITEAKKLWKAGDLDKARELFAQTVNELKGNDSVDAMLALATANTSLGKLDLNSGNYQLAIEEYKNSQKYWKEYDGDKTADYVDVTADLAKAYKQAGQLSNASKTYKWLLDQPYPSSVSEIRQELANQYANILWAEGRFKNVPNLAAQLSDPEKYKKLIGKSTAH